MPQYPIRKSFPKRKVIICEGSSDEAFFRALLLHANITDFSVRNSSDIDRSGGNRGGIDKFGAMLSGMATWDGFPDLTDIVLVADADRNPQANFLRVVAQIAGAAPETIPATVYGVPSHIQQKAPGSPASISVMLLPNSTTAGNIESLCLQSASGVSAAVTACVDAFVRCTGADQWTDATKIDKLRLLAMIGSQNEQNPAVGLGNIWRQAPHLIPIADPCFQPIINYLLTI